jgi:hypothetical protein
MLVPSATLQASIAARNRVLRVGFPVANPQPYDTKSPVVSVIDFEGLREGERPIFVFVQQAPYVHVAAVTEKLLEGCARNKTFIAQLAKVRCSAAPYSLRAGMLLKHVVALRLAEGAMRSGFEALQHSR